MSIMQWKAVALLISGAVIGLGVDRAFFPHDLLPDNAVRPVRQSEINADPVRPLIDPILYVRNVDTKDSPVLDSLQAQVQQIIDAAKVGTTSVYVRDLTSSDRFFINEEEKFSPASLMKVPMLMTYLKVAEGEPTVLEQRIALNGMDDQNGKESIRSSQPLPMGKVYPVRELLEHMIIYSDNNAAAYLVSFLPRNQKLDFLGLLRDLGVDSADATTDYMNIRTYALFFRVLYNSSYLSRDHSQYALELLSKTEYSDGIRGVVPKGVAVAEKFGEYKLQNEDGVQLKRELHDCGIVYVPNHPYLLCVMTKGQELPVLQQEIRTIAKATYDFFADRK